MSTYVYLSGPGLVRNHLAVHPTTGRLYVCNEANHEIWVLHPDTLVREATITTGNEQSCFRVVGV